MRTIPAKTTPNSTTANIIQSYVNCQQRGRVFTTVQLIEKKGISDKEKSAALRALSRLVKNKELVRLSYGAYYRPRLGTFGRLPIETDELVKSVTKTKKATVIPAGVAAVNALGLDTQLPMVKSYFISERVRSKYNVKNVKFEYKESLHYFAAHFKVTDDNQRETALLFWSAVSHMDKSGIELYKNELTKKFTSLLTSKTQQQFFKALSPSMKWVHKSLTVR
ncbi:MULTISPECIES: DUF6088 family protein [Vibrio]|uniref:DUF6088 family protein n=1 Tax=Vibrio TaxID=662 RepID=UPI000C8657C3|nr:MULTISPECIES: DUF6088 family protein [Vibrio]PMF55279.1 hypothetical protein BCV12_01935 [Vibrio cyclitrophicus]CAK1770331.1 conserved hypothetical protein [Vibrio crassostreae]